MQGGQEELLTTAAPALIADVLRRFGNARLRVAGASMLPAIRPRDVLFVERRAIQQIQIGDIVLFALDDRLFAHRVVRRDVDEAGAPTLVTRGDTHRDEDLPIASNQLLGQVLTVTRNGLYARRAISVLMGRESAVAHGGVVPSAASQSPDAAARCPEPD